MNTYCFTFPFRGEYQFFKMDANMLANQLVNMMGDYDFIYEEGQYYEKPFLAKIQKLMNLKTFVLVLILTTLHM